MKDNKSPKAVPPTGKLLEALLKKVDDLECHSGIINDPFVFNRMRAHVRAGIETFS